MTGDRASRWRGRLTIPNALSLFRMLAAPMLVVLAASGRRGDVVLLFLVMSVTDWVDGKLAVALDQRSDIGPRMDSVADLLMYGALLSSTVLLGANRLALEWAWILTPILLYPAAGVLSLMKFGRWPHHHTRMAKISWGLMLIGGVAFLMDWSPWPLRVALASATLASVQSILITQILPEWQADVLSVAAARRIRHAP
jgi:cardiolipin synthase